MVNKHIKKHGPKTLALIALLALAVSAGVYVGNRIFNKKSVTPQKTPDVVTYSTDNPDETKPDKKTYQWKGSANDPKYITIASVGVEGFLQKVGVDQNKQIAVPNNVYMAGWFNETPRPGEAGNSIIDGHVTGRVNKGIFEKLTGVKIGDDIKVEFGDGSSKSFKAKKSVAVETKDAAAVMFSQEPNITKQLTLVTCTGKWDSKINQYTQRLIVIAEAI